MILYQKKEKRKMNDLWKKLLFRTFSFVGFKLFLFYIVKKCQFSDGGSTRH